MFCAIFSNPSLLKHKRGKLKGLILKSVISNEVSHRNNIMKGVKYNEIMVIILQVPKG